MSKKIIYTLFLLILTSCYPTSKIYPFIQDFNENIVFKIDQIQEGAIVSSGKNPYTPSKGNKFVFIYFTFFNRTSVKQGLFLDNIYLLDDSQKRYRVEFTMTGTSINVWGKTESYIDPDDNKTRKLVFNFPKNMRPKYLLVNGKEVELKYKK